MVTVEAAGFKKSIKKDVTIEVSTVATINFEMIPGATAETVQVSASEIALNTTQPELGSTIEPVVVAALPVEVSGRGRQIDQLQFLAPGTTGGTFSHRISGGVDFQQEIMYNGIPIPQSETEGYTTNYNPPFELVEEYRVERTTFSAQYGLGQGALTYQMKSGTNSYHGDLFEINRNSLFDSVGFFNGTAWGGDGKPSTDHENNYGFSIGGPIRIPHVYDGRNKTFGHYSQEWFKENSEDTDLSTVPTAAEKKGDFTDFVDATTGDMIPIYDPTTGKQFECDSVKNVICTNRFSALSKKLIPSIPDPDRTGTGVGGLNNNKNYTPFVNPKIQHVWGFTVDHNLTPTQSIHYSQWRNTFSNWSFDNAPLVVAPNPLNSMKWEPSVGSVFLLNYSNTLSPKLVMTAGAAWVGEVNNQFNQTNYSFGGVTGGTIPPEISFDGSHTLTTWGTSGAWLQSVNRKLGISLVNNWLWMKGRNTFNIGHEFRRSYQDDNEEQTQGGHFAFSQRTTSVQNVDDANFGNYGSAFASFLLGIPDAVNRSNSQELRLRNLAYSPYIQDDIKLSSRLTLNVGLRWDITVPFTEVHNHVVFFDPTHVGTDPLADNIAGSARILGTCSTCAGFNRADVRWGHFGPRVGFAYKLNEKTVVQGGFDLAFLNGGAYEYGTHKVAVNYGNLLVGSYTRSSTGSYTSSYGSWDSTSLPNPSATAFSAGLGGGTQINAFSREDGYAPYTQQWNLNVQRELPWGTFLTAAYVGNRIIHLPSVLNPINQLNPSYLSMGSKLADVFKSGVTTLDGVARPYTDFVSDFGGSATVAQALVPYPQYSYILNNFEGSGTTFYNSAQVEIEKRFSNGLSFLAGYTLSHLLDNTSSGFVTFTTNAVNKYNQKPEWGVSTSDESQTLKASGTYELPIGPNKKFIHNKKIGAIAGGWQVGWILDYETGTAFGISEDLIPYPNATNRPNRNTAVGIGMKSYKTAKNNFIKGTTNTLFNTNAFTQSKQYVLGDAKRTYGELRNPPYLMESLNASKKFNFGSHMKGILTVDYFNAFNRTQFEGPDSEITDSSFGQVSSGSQINNRQGQVQFRLEF